LYYEKGFKDPRITQMGWTWSRVILRLLDIDPERRMSLDEVLKTPMLTCQDPVDAVMSGLDKEEFALLALLEKVS
jgi:hypothetical protein